MGSFDLTTTGAVKAYEGITGEGDDSLILSIIGRVTGLMEAYTGRELKSRVHSYLTDPPSEYAVLDGLTNRLQRQLLHLPQYPLSVITTVRINELAIDRSTGVSVSGWFFYSCQPLSLEYSAASLEGRWELGPSPL